MISYSIDASVYAYPFKKGNSYTGEELTEYYDTINNFFEIIVEKQPRDKKFYLFSSDIEFINDHDELKLLEQNISPLNQMVENKEIDFREVQEHLDNIIKRLLFPTSDDDPLSEIIIFENWFHIEDVKFKDDNYPLLPDEVSEKIGNEELIKNTTKNIAKIAYLNEYVYKSGEFHNIILNNYIQAQPISIDGWEFDIKMAKEIFTDEETDEEKINNYIIKNAPLEKININEQKQVNISKLDVLLKNNYRYDEPGEWKKALNDAENNFKHLKFGHDVNKSLEEYIYKINIEKNNPLKANDLEAINNWDKEGPDLLYNYLKTLNDFVSIPANLSKDKYSINSDERERYHCNRNCEFYMNCSSNLRFYGVDCVPESRGIREDREGLDQFDFVKVDRTIRNSKKGGFYSIYWTHLKPKSVKCYKSLWFLTLRIHFILLVTEQKIEIGHIGRHLYHPCTVFIDNPKASLNMRIKQIKDRERCEYGRGIECPQHPLNPLESDELTNYRGQWPKPKLENEQSKANE